MNIKNELNKNNEHRSQNEQKEITQAQIDT